MPVTVSSSVSGVTESSMSNAVDNLMKSPSMQTVAKELERKNITIHIEVIDEPNTLGARINEDAAESEYTITIPIQVFDGDEYDGIDSLLHPVTFERQFSHELYHLISDIINHTDSEIEAEDWADKVMGEAYGEVPNISDSNPKTSTPGTPNFNDDSAPGSNDPAWPTSNYNPLVPSTVPLWLQPVLSVPGVNGISFGLGGGLDPLVFDLNGNGVIELASTVNSGVLFDYWGNDFAQGTGWLAAGANKDGMLAWDIDGFRSIKSCELSK